MNTENELTEDDKALKQMEREMAEGVYLCTYVVNQKIIHHATPWDTIVQCIATGAALKVQDVPQSLVDHLYNAEDTFFTLRQEMHDDPCWLNVYGEFLDAGILIHNSEDNSAGEVVRSSGDGVPMLQEQVMEHWVKPTTSREEIVQCIAYAIEGSPDYVRSDCGAQITGIAQSRDVLQTLSVVFPHCEWFEIYTKMREEDLLEPTHATLRRVFTEDGYSFYEQQDGTWQDKSADMSFPSFGDLEAGFKGDGITYKVI